MRAQLTRWGDSLAVGLPPRFAESAGLREGATVELDIVDGVLRLRRPRYTLDELLAQITPENLPTETFDDPPVGEEQL